MDIISQFIHLKTHILLTLSADGILRRAYFYTISPTMPKRTPVSAHSLTFTCASPEGFWELRMLTI